MHLFYRTPARGCFLEEIHDTYCITWESLPKAECTNQKDKKSIDERINTKFHRQKHIRLFCSELRWLNESLRIHCDTHYAGIFRLGFIYKWQIISDFCNSFFLCTIRYSSNVHFLTFWNLIFLKCIHSSGGMKGCI